MYRTKELYDEWNEMKKDIHFQEWGYISRNLYINEKEIRYVWLGLNIWCEQNGKREFMRPVLVIKKIGNMFFCVPLTTKGNINQFYYKLMSCRFDKPSTLILSQWRTLDKRRFMDKIWYISDEEFSQIKKLLKDMYL